MPTPTTTRQPTRVHVAGPLETESFRGRRRSVQRCLRCDAILWTTAVVGTRPALGDPVVWVEVDGTLVLRQLGRASLRDGEIVCEPIPFAAL